MNYYLNIISLNNTMKNFPLEVENNILSYLDKPLNKRNRCCAITENNRVCKNKAKKDIFCHIHSKIFEKSLKTSNIYDSIYVKSKFLKR